MKNKQENKNLKLKGIAASPGIVIGKIHIIDKHDFKVSKRVVSEAEVSNEIMRFEDALMKTREEIVNIIEHMSPNLEGAHVKIFNAHLLLLEDRMIIEEVIKTIKTEKYNVEYVFFQVLQKFMETLSCVDDEYIRERIADIKDVGKRILKNLMGEETLSLELEEESVIAAFDIAPSDTAMMNRSMVKGFVTDIGSRTSHTAIVARSLEIPAVVGLQNITKHVSNKDIIIIDGDKGYVIVDPDEKTIK
ncbi:phosphoenolpyruvate--protein phosphotransferase, partial [bacterium]|nr:phosphoenolpyruvate--protein phosphotransferase [bacterium]